MAWRFVSWNRRKWYQELTLEVTVCFMSASAVNCLPVRCFIRGPKVGKSVGLLPPTVHVLVVDYGATAGRLWTAFATVLILCAVFCFCLNTVRITSLGSGSWRTAMWNKFPPPASIFSDAGIQALVWWLDRCLNVNCLVPVGLMCAICYLCVIFTSSQ